MAQLPIGTFLTNRLKEYDSTFELRPGTAFESLFFKPMQYIVQPLWDEMASVFTSQSLSRILATSDPDSYDEEAVDAIVSNVYVYRRAGATATGVARVYYNDPADYEYPTGGFAVTSSNGYRYLNSGPFNISRADMSLNIEDGLYYYDIPIVSETTGVGNNAAEGEIVSVENDNLYIRVSNLTPVAGGLDKETNTELINRTVNSIAVRDLLTGKGINAILWESFSAFLAEIKAIGFGDEEMMRDIVYNTHIGGKVDVYIKTSSITSLYRDFEGLEYDFTRQTYASKNCQMVGTTWTDLGNPNLDRSNGLAPTMIEIKTSTAAEYLSPVDLSLPIDLSSNQYIKIGIDGTIKDVRVAGVVPSATTRNEIIGYINYAMGITVAFVSGNSFKLRSPTYGLSSSVYVDNPSIGTSALTPVFGLTSAKTVVGDGPVTFLEGVHYEVDDTEGRIRRVLGSSVVSTQTTGRTTIGSAHFKDLTPGAFASVSVRDIITIYSGADAGDYRVIELIDDNEFILDAELTATDTSIVYSIARTGIKNNELVYTTYYYNPISIDIGKYIKLDEYGRTRGIRTGRENYTISDLPLLRITYIEEIDPLSGESTGYILDGTGGFGQGGYGRGGFGRGAGRDWALKVNSPTERFSMFEDSYIVFQPAMAALSVRVHFEYVPELEGVHTFCRSDDERIVDGDILVKHFLPAYVSGTIQYSVTAGSSESLTNDEVTAAVKSYINSVKSTMPLEMSNIIQYIARTLDPYDKYGLYIRPFTLSAEIHNTNGTTDKITSNDKLVIPTLDPFPLDTDRPLSPKIAHWVADNITMVRL